MRYFLSLLLCFLTVHAQSAEARSSDLKGFMYYNYDQRAWKEIEEYATGGYWSQLFHSNREIRLICNRLSHISVEEYGRLLYREEHGEIYSDEHAHDLEELYQYIKVNFFEGTGQKYVAGGDFDTISIFPCRDIVAKAYAYAEKWGKRFWNEKQKYLQETLIWANQQLSELPVTAPSDPDDAYRTFIVKDVVFHVPRAALWRGSQRPDFTIETGANLIFYGPNARVGVDENNTEPQANIGITVLVDNSNGGWLRPCQGFADKEVCFGGGGHTTFVHSILWCMEEPFTGKAFYKSKLNRAEAYAARWRRECVPYEPFVWNRTMQMMGNRSTGVGGGYFEGDPEFPDYWIRCSHDYNKQLKQDRGMCKSGFPFRGKNGELYSRYPFAYYYIPIQMAKSHKTIHESITQKVNSYVLYSRKPLQVD